jgi:hypothetical protein
MENAAGEWRGIKAVTNAQCRHLGEISNGLQDRFAWRVATLGILKTCPNKTLAFSTRR